MSPRTYWPGLVDSINLQLCPLGKIDYRVWRRNYSGSHAKIEQPAFFIAGKKDLVLSFAGDGRLAAMDPWVPNLRGKVIIEGAGHWVQTEQPAPQTKRCWAS